MSLPEKASEQRERVITSAPLGVLLAWDRWEKMSNDRVVCHL